MKFSETFQDQQLASEFIRRSITVGVCILVPIVIAYWIATGQSTILAACLAMAVVVLVVAAFRDRAWLIIPISWTLTGTSGFLPNALSLHDLGISLAFCAYIGYRVLAHTNKRRHLHVLDLLLVLNILWVGVTFLRHPAGLRAFGAQMIGARPYVNIALALLAYKVILGMADSAKDASRVPYFILAGTAIIALVNLVVYISPAITPYVYGFYSGIDTTGFLDSPAQTAVYHRWEHLAGFGRVLVLVTCSAVAPRVLFSPLRWQFYVLALGFAAILAAGYRNVLLYAMVALVLASWLHGNWSKIIPAAVAGAVFLSALLFGQGRLYQLPLPAQRTLCFLPGQWSPPIVAEAEASSQNRFQWWRDVIREHVIQDWWTGDGFGVSAADFNIFVSQGMTVQLFDWFNLTGAFHNGPLTTIRYAGIIGLVLFYAYMIAAAIFSVKCVNRCRGTPLFMVSVFLAIQLLWLPVHFTFVFGDFSDQLPQHIFMVGLLLLLWRMSERQSSSPGPAKSLQALSPHNRETLVAT